MNSSPDSKAIATGGRHEGRSLEAIFAPRTVALIGATDTPASVGRSTFQNLLNERFEGIVFPVHLKRGSVMGVKAYPRIGAVPEPVDLAVIATPAATVPGIVAECAEAGVKGAIIISAGFREHGPEGARLEQEVLQAARRTGMRLVGPNCLGVMVPSHGLNATFASSMALPGKVGFLSQSGALCTSILDWSLREHVGFSAFLSVGSMLDVGWGDLIDYLGDDPNTRSIVMYIESIGDARSFLSAAREVALTKPIIVIKTGRTEAAAQAAVSHTGALTGSDEVLEAAFRRCGVLRVETIAELFEMAEVLAKQPRPAGPRLAILTNAGGPGVLATDSLIRHGGELAALSPESRQALDAFLPPHWSRNNPVDILGDADPERYRRALEILARAPENDGLLVILSPQGMTDPAEAAAALVPHAQGSKPLLASWMGGESVAAGKALLNRSNIPTFEYPDTAARAFHYMWRYSSNLRALYETPSYPPAATEETLDREEAQRRIQTARQEGRTVLSEYESKRILQAYGIPTVETRLASDEEEALPQARALGYPVVLKLHSDTLTHKSDLGGVRLHLQEDRDVQEAFRAIRSAVEQHGAIFQGVSVQPMIRHRGYELILGSSIDPQFGPVLLFGWGGRLVEVLRDRVLGLPPLNTTLARRMMEQTRIFTALQGIRGEPGVDLQVLEKLLVRFSQLVVEQRMIREIDINPLLVSAHGPLALDARIILHPPEVSEADLPRTAIRPYPLRYIGTVRLRDGTSATIRPIRPEDEPLMVKFHESLSDRSVYLRYMHLIKLSQRVAHERLTRICFIDYDREMALVAVRPDPETGQEEILGVGRLTKLRSAGEAEFAILVSDRFQGYGLGTELLGRLLQVGRDEGIRRIVARILPDNTHMQHVSQKLGFRLHYAANEQLVYAALDLEEAPLE